MSTLTKVLTIAFSVYALIAIVLLISENRRPQATLAWALAFFFMLLREGERSAGEGVARINRPPSWVALQSSASQSSFQTRGQ